MAACARTVARGVARAFAVGVALLVAAAAVPSLTAPVYRFPEPLPFAGEAWLNPYEGVETLPWRTVNLHAHSAAWGGVTHGTATPAQVRAAYRRLGYDAIAVSNYHQVTSAPGAGTLPVYEHGVNAAKAHVLVVGARTVRWLDFPLVQTVHHQQRVLDHLRGAGALLAVPHPGVRGARDTHVLRALTGYQLMEVTSKYGTWEREWDTALGAGRLVWGLGGDDAHNVRDPTQVGESWTLVASASAAPESLLAALAVGRHMAVSGHRGRTALRVRRVVMRDGVLTVQVDGPVTELAFVGAEGRVRHRVTAGTGAYRPTPDDGYLRVVARGDSSVLYLNPVVRHRGRGVVALAAVVDAQGTWAVRTAGGMSALLLIPRVRRRTLSAARAGGPLVARGLRRLAARAVSLMAAGITGRRRREGAAGQRPG